MTIIGGANYAGFHSGGHIYIFMGFEDHFSENQPQASTCPPSKKIAPIYPSE